MKDIREIFSRFWPQIIHIVAIPLFFTAFMVIYTPFGADTYLGEPKPGFGFHVTMLMCIIAACLGLSRSIMYIFRRKLNVVSYVAWCFLDMLVSALFMGLYIWLIKKMLLPYFSVVMWSFVTVTLISVYPYVIIALGLLLRLRRKQIAAAHEDPDDRIRFYDSRKVLKLVVKASSIYYISADENYININYQEEGGKTIKYVLRASMKSIEELCARNSLIRCHRSYFVNPAHVKVLRKNPDGLVFADMDCPETVSIPITKKYYDNLTGML